VRHFVAAVTIVAKMPICIDVAHAAGHRHCVLSGLCSTPSTIIPRGTIIFRQGQTSHGVFVLRAGRVLLSLSDGVGRPRMIRIARAGDILGLATLFTRRAYDSTAEVGRAAQFSFVPHKEVLRRLDEHPHARFEVLRQLSHDVISCHDLVRSGH
jgi:CRP-like cAMP-binding protein